MARWRKAERERLIALRLALPADTRAAMAQKIASHLDAPSAIPGRTGQPLLAVSRRAGPAALDGDGRRTRRPHGPARRGRQGPAAGLPRVEGRRTTGKGRLEHSRPGCRRCGVARHRHRPAGRLRWRELRLGYGGGFFDRTIASMPVRPRVIGVGYGLQKIATILPQPHDIPMDVIVTEAGVAA